MSVRLRYLYRAFRYLLHVDPAEVRFVCSQLVPGDVAVDIGSHKGAYTYWMRRSVGPSGAVFAFEPHPQQVAYLRETFAAMRYENVEVIPMAVSNVCGDVSLHMPTGRGQTHAASLEAFTIEREAIRTGTSATSVAETTLVPATTIDQFFENRRAPRFLKIDVEGHELAVLEGARQTIDSCRPSILVECETRHHADGDVAPVFELLNSLGYEGVFFLNGRQHPISEFNPSAHQHMPVGSDSPPRGYVNNFAFMAKA